VIRKLLGWRHSGVGPHNAVCIGVAETDERRGLTKYILRFPFSTEKTRYQAKMHRVRIMRSLNNPR
jgi:hypothetical protein